MMSGTLMLSASSRRIFGWNVIIQVIIGYVSGSTKTAHCWNENSICNGTITQSFRNSSDCCKFGGKSYIVCDQKTLKEILMQMGKKSKGKRQELCVACPPKKQKKRAASCKQRTCKRPDRACIEMDNKTFCIKCENKLAICGSDKKTYANECVLFHTKLRRNVHPVYYGPCQAKATCSKVKCKKGQRCSSKKGYPTCVKIPQPYCGSDDKTYASSGALKKAYECRGIHAKHRGPCPNDPVPVDPPTCKRKKKTRLWGK